MNETDTAVTQRIEARRPQVERLINQRPGSTSWIYELLQEYVNDNLPAAALDGDSIDDTLLNIAAVCFIWLEKRQQETTP